MVSTIKGEDERKKLEERQQKEKDKTLPEHAIYNHIICHRICSSAGHRQALVGREVHQFDHQDVEGRQSLAVVHVNVGLEFI